MPLVPRLTFLFLFILKSSSGGPAVYFRGTVPLFNEKSPQRVSKPLALMTDPLSDFSAGCSFGTRPSENPLSPISAGKHPFRHCFAWHLLFSCSLFQGIALFWEAGTRQFSKPTDGLSTAFVVPLIGLRKAHSGLLNPPIVCF